LDVAINFINKDYGNYRITQENFIKKRVMENMESGKK
jgi:hypothetical protein